MEWRTTWKQIEVKYLLTSKQYSKLLKILNVFGTQAAPFHEYKITTTYHGQWKQKYIKGKIRERWYSTGGHYIEEKIRDGIMVYKHRVPWEEKDTFKPISSDITPLNITLAYFRQAWTLQDVRITIDTDVMLDDKIIFDGYIMELKGDQIDSVQDLIEDMLNVSPRDLSKYGMARAYYGI